MVKAKISEGLVAKLLMVEIVRIIVVLIYESSGAFLQNSHGRGRPGLGPYWSTMTRAQPHRAGLSGQKELLPALSFF